MDLKLLRDNWNSFGETDPMWSILMEPDRDKNRWDKREFFQRGMCDVEFAMHTARQFNFPLRQGTALDFGCGVGRLTQGLACYFDQVHGVDIAASMIEQAQRYNPYGQRCQFHLNERDDLRLFRDNQFDFVFSVIVTQHIRSDYVQRYIAEFMRILAPGGLLLFQHPSHYSQAELGEICESIPVRAHRKAKFWLHKQAKRVRRKLTGGPRLSIGQQKYDRLEPRLDEAVAKPRDDSEPANASSDKRGTITRIDAPRCEHHPIKRRTMVAYLKSLGGHVIDVRQRPDCGPHWASYRYSVTKQRRDAA